VRGQAGTSASGGGTEVAPVVSTQSGKAPDNPAKRVVQTEESSGNPGSVSLEGIRGASVDLGSTKRSKKKKRDTFAEQSAAIKKTSDSAS